jgi:hypothetical protein
MGLLTRAGTIQINAASNSSPVPTPFLRRKTAFKWGTVRGLIDTDGSNVTSVDGSFLLPVGMTTLYLGGGAGSTGQLNGTLESIAYYAGARVDAFVQAVSR